MCVEIVIGILLNYSLLVILGSLKELDNVYQNGNWNIQILSHDFSKKCSNDKSRIDLSTL